MPSTPNPALMLFRRMLSNVKKLAPDAQPYYRQIVISNFRQYQDERDPEDIANLLKRGENDMNWLMQKYGIRSNKNSCPPTTDKC